VPSTTENTTAQRIRCALNRDAGGLRFRQCAIASLLTLQQNNSGDGFRFQIHDKTAPTAHCWTRPRLVEETVGRTVPGHGPARLT
jgi:hypothetical protein